jgi:hypoxanthine-DNA glycosylase
MSPGGGMHDLPADAGKLGLPPLVSAGTRVLVLGSFPGRRSRAERQYYAHPQNRFWPVMEELLGIELRSLAY